MTSDDLAKLLAEGRGRGEGKDYKPFVKVQDFSSYGQANRDFGETTGRQHDYFSKIEHQYHLILDYSNLLDIQEQFPLLPLEKTVDIANQCGIRHPVVFKTKRPKIMTVDFRISVPIPVGKKVIFRSVKPAAKLLEGRVVEILELERRFMESSNEDWGIVTERELNPALVENLIWTYKFRRLSSLAPLSEETIYKVSCVLTEDVLQRESSLSNIALECDDIIGLKPGTSLSVARHLIASRQWQVDMLRRIDPCKQLILAGIALSSPAYKKASA